MPERATVSSRCEKSAAHHIWYEPQPHEPPSADPHARWCGRGAVMLTAPYPDYAQHR
jgi:hypothetical protein